MSFRQVGAIEKLNKLGLVSLKNGMNWGWCLLGRLVLVSFRQVGVGWCRSV